MSTWHVEPVKKPPDVLEICALSLLVISKINIAMEMLPATSMPINPSAWENALLISQEQPAKVESVPLVHQ